MDVDGKHVCSLQADVVTDTFTFACGPTTLATTPGVKAFGAPLTSPTDLCENGFTLPLPGRTRLKAHPHSRRARASGSTRGREWGRARP